jgi:Tfp pilus assembly protein PilE
MGSLLLEQDVTGLYLAVSSPSLPVVVNREKLGEAKARLSEVQSRIEIFEVGTGNQSSKIDLRMPIKHFAWSYCGRFLATCGSGANSSTRLTVLPKPITESIMCMIDALKHDKHFWLKFTVDMR